MAHEIKPMEVWGGNYTTEESVNLPGLVGHVIARPSKGHLRGDIFLLSACSVGAMAKILIVDTFNRGPQLGLLSQEMRRLLATYGSEYDNSRLTASFSGGVSRMMNLRDSVRLTAATLDTRTGELICAHQAEPDILMRRGDGPWLKPPDNGQSVRAIPVGGIEGTAYRQSVVGVSPGDWLLFYTSGLTALFDAAAGDQSRLLSVAGGRDGPRVLSNSLDGIDADDPQTLAHRLIDALEGTGKGPPAPGHDMTLLVLRVTA